MVVAPGGIGTLLELMYVWQLLQLRTVEPRPFILMGRDYWKGLIDWVREMPAEQKLVDLRDLSYVSLVDTPDEALEILGPQYAAFLEEQKLRTASLEEEQREIAGLQRTTQELAQDLSVQIRRAEAGLPATPAN